MAHADSPTRLAVTAMSRTATVLVCTLAPALLLRLLFNAADGAPAGVIVDGQLSLAPALGPYWWLALGVTILGWCWGLAAAVLVIGAAMRGRAVRATTALRTAFWRLPIVLTSVLLTVITIGLASLPLLVMARERLGPAVLLVGLSPLLLVLLVVIWLPLVVPAAVVEGARGRTAFAAARATVRGRFGIRLAMILGLVMLPMLLLWWIGWLRAEAAAGPSLWAGALTHAVVELIVTVALLLLAAVYATLLAQLHRRGGLEPEEETGARLDRLARTVPARPRLQVTLAGRALAWVTAVTLPATLLAVVTVANPYGIPVVSSDPIGGERRIVAAGWGAHGHPVLVTLDRIIEWCLDDRCLEVEWERVPVPIHSDPSTATVGADGSVLVTSFDEPGQMRVVRCVNADACRLVEIDWPGRGWPSAAGRAVAVGQDGSLLTATAVAVFPDGADPEEDDPEGVELTLGVCEDLACDSPRFIDFGVVEARPPDVAAPGGFLTTDGALSRQQRREDTLWLGVDAQGAPMLVFRDIGDGRTWVGRCETTDCAEPTLTEVPPGDGAMLPAGVPTGGWAADLPTPDLLAVAPAGRGVVTVFAEPAPERLEIRIGEQSTRWRLSMRHCPDLACDTGRTSVLREIGLGQHDVHLAVRDDGTVLLVLGGGWDSNYQLLTWATS